MIFTETQTKKRTSEFKRFGFREENSPYKGHKDKFPNKTKNITIKRISKTL